MKNIKWGADIETEGALGDREKLRNVMISINMRQMGMKLENQILRDLEPLEEWNSSLKKIK